MIFVTNDARDFRRLYAELDLHPGLVIILPKVKQPRQSELFSVALVEIEKRCDIVDQLIEVDEEAKVAVRGWPPTV